jgi:fused signal recognition particle receptor
MFRSITLFCLILTFTVIVLGAYVRLSDAGLGCPDWPGCYGKAVVSSNAEFAEQAKQAFPGSSLDVAKAWKEMGHRYVAGILSIFVLVLNILAWREKSFRTAAVASSLLLLGFIGLQAALGMWTVKMKVMPIVVTSHLLMGLLSFWLIFWIFLRSKKGINRSYDLNGVSKGFLLVAALVLFSQIFLGGWVSTNKAALACMDFPQCNGSWWPQVNYLNALKVFEGLMTGYQGTLSYDGQIAIHWLHRVVSVVTFLVLSGLMLSATSGRKPRLVRKGGLFLAILLFIQISLGIANIKLGLPMWAAVMHNGFAALIMLPLIYIGFYSKYSYSTDEQESTTKARFDSGEPVPVGIPAEVVEEVYVEPKPESLYLRLRSQLQKTRSGLGGVLSGLSLKQKTIDDDLLEEIESSLIMADIGVDASSEIIGKLTERVKHSQLRDAEALSGALKQELLEILEPCDKPLHISKQETPFVILVVGVNGVGKTTTIGKLAKRLQAQGLSVMLAAGDTFRAAAVEQLQAWGERNKIQVVAQHTGADSASVIYDGVESAKAKGVDVLIADTAGRLHTKSNLMDELKKVKRIMAKVDASAPHEVLLVLDAGTGQNAISQTRIFHETVELTGIALTKLDGTAKGGVIFALAKQFGLPIRYIGVGEGIDDLQDFHAEQFVDALFATET